MQELFDRYDRILSGELKSIDVLSNQNYKTYAITNFRGGIGKTTLSFNLAYSMCKKYMTLFLDMCPQQNFTSLFLNSTKPYEGQTIYDALMEKMMGSAWKADLHQLSLRVQDTNVEFQNGKTCYFIPGSSRLFLFPSQFYSRLNEYLGMTASADGEKPVSILLRMLKTIIEEQLEETKADVVMMPYDVAFDAGGKPTFSYFRERIVKNTGRPLWEGRVHEVITPYGNILHEDIHVEHRKEKAYDTDRNLLIYEKMRAEGCVFSPREQFYYARELYYHGRYGEAIDEFRVFMGREGAWLENKLEACRQMAVCYGQLQKPQEQLEALFYSFTLDLPRAETCCDLGRYYFDRQAWREAAFWYETALRVEKRKNGGGFIREDCYGYLPCIQLCVCYDRLGRREKAVSYNEMAAVFKPEDRAVAYNRAYFANVSKG